MSESSSTSRSLLVRAGLRDPDAWERLVALYAPLVMYWLRRWRLPEADTADVFQEIFQAVATRIAEFRKQRDGDTFRGWLRTIARNKVADHYRRASGEARAEGGTMALVRLAQLSEPLHHEAESSDGSESAARDDLVRRALEQIRQRVHVQTWRAFWRTVIDEQPTSDVAEELSMSTGAVRVAKSRVLHKLREELGDLIE